MSKVATAEHPQGVEGRGVHPRICEQNVRCVRYGDSKQFSYKAVTVGQLRLTDSMYVCVFPAIVIVMVPCTYCVRSDVTQENNESLDSSTTDFTFTVDLVLNGFIMFLSGLISNRS